MNLARADGHQADGAAATDQDGLPLHLRLLHTVDAGAHGFQHRALLVGEGVVQADDAGFGDYGVFGKGTRVGDAKDVHIFTDMRVPDPTL